MVESSMNIDLVVIPSTPALVVPKAFLETYTVVAFLNLLDSLLVE